MFTSPSAQKCSLIPTVEGARTCVPRTTAQRGASLSSLAKTPPKATSRPASRLPPRMATLSQSGSGSAPQQVAPYQPPAWDITAQPIQASLGKACNSCRGTKSLAQTQTSSAIITKYGCSLVADCTLHGLTDLPGTLPRRWGTSFPLI